MGCDVGGMGGVMRWVCSDCSSEGAWSWGCGVGSISSGGGDAGFGRASKETVPEKLEKVTETEESALRWSLGIAAVDGRERRRLPQVSTVGGRGATMTQRSGYEECVEGERVLMVAWGMENGVMIGDGGSDMDEGGS